MDLTPYIGSIVTIVIAVVGGYVAMKNAITQEVQGIRVDLTRVETKVDDLTTQVEKHNSVMERTFRLEEGMTTAYKRIDELREKDIRLEDKIDGLKGTE